MPLSSISFVSEALMVSMRSQKSDKNTDVDGLNETPERHEVFRWSSTGSRWKDLLYFVGPGWFICIAYVDPGNYQADIQAGAMTQYSLLWTVWWASMLSIYVQSLCVRLAYYSQTTLAEAQALDNPRALRYINWAIAEFTVVITDLPEVIGIGIACNIFFGWPYYAGILLSFVTTFLFLALLNYGMRLLETVVVVFVGIMSVVLWAEMGLVGADGPALIRGWVYGFVDATAADLFSITGIVGAVVMPHNLYLHTASCQTRRVVREKENVKKAVHYASWEPALPVVVSFFINMAIVSLAAEKIFGQPGAETAGLSNFCDFFLSINGACILFGIALVSAGQSSAITTTFTGQYIMDGFLSIRLPVWVRALLTRTVAIVPCIAVSAAYPEGTELNTIVNVVNSALSFLLPFALTPLVKYNCSQIFMGEFASRGIEKYVLHTLAFAVYMMNAIALSAPGGGFFGLHSHTC